MYMERVIECIYGQESDSIRKSSWPVQLLSVVIKCLFV